MISIYIQAVCSFVYPGLEARLAQEIVIHRTVLTAYCITNFETLPVQVVDNNINKQQKFCSLYMQCVFVGNSSCDDFAFRTYPMLSTD